MIQFTTLALLKAYTTPSPDVLYCLNETGKVPIFFIWNNISTQTTFEPIIIKLDNLDTGRMIIDKGSTVVSIIQPTGTPPIADVNYIWKQNDVVNSYDSLIEYNSTSTDWSIKSARTRTHTDTPDSIPVIPNFEGEFFIDTTASVLYVGLNGGWTIVNGASS